MLLLVLQDKPDDVNEKFVQQYVLYYTVVSDHFAGILESDIYVEHDGIVENKKEIWISDHPALQAYLQDRVQFWKQTAQDLQDLYNKNTESDLDFFTQLALMTVIHVGCYTPKIFYEACDSIRHDKFVGPEAKPQAINILELQNREWLFSYRQFRGPNLGGDYTRT